MGHRRCEPGQNPLRLVVEDFSFSRDRNTTGELEDLSVEQVIIVGAGPCGLAAAVELRKRGIDPLLIEKGCVVNSIYGYPINMVFFSTSERLEIGDVPFIVPGEKPSREEALSYYRTVAQRTGVRIHTYEEVETVEKGADRFRVWTVKRTGERKTYEARYIVVATGYFDNPNYLDVPGEELEKVTHYYREAHPYQGQKVAIIGGNNNAVEAALAIERAGGEVTWIYRRADYSPSIKAWVRPVFESIINRGVIKAMWTTEVKRIETDRLVLLQEGREVVIENDAVLALTGYRPNRRLLTSLGVQINEDSGEPVFNPETMETNVADMFIAGVIAAGNNANAIFIENGRDHGAVLAANIEERLKKLS
ncbi:YpdA family putative bacillithiol disulfide reductase [Aneurinibacillus sp. Ricciae_BoGa-3]|uniref:YpdA family putative bacillithiol disulfide reductase n=1 Tax=Aneurinibacillus sp. Ricciae_BoGa-3 TaxID=3022697 RepID=UPI0023415EE9|nr:YpdA family putative bacillithiol disulfide reductase [Aneurinibacillus sp. Ricciae_BoGa-3]WCK56056.1 YpdA family putative bacillithiol disulfide reductase [Aneurinibacillus sp. Ricciae_BoGa-3]